MNDLLSFGTWLKDRRKKLDLTQFDLADRVGCSEDTIQKIERGERRPSKQIAQRLAECLRVPPDEHEALVAAARAGGIPAPTFHAHTVAHPDHGI
jgi:putative transcriptional regulator